MPGSPFYKEIFVLPLSSTLYSARPEEALDAGGDSTCDVTPLYHVPTTGQHGAMQENMVGMSGTGRSRLALHLTPHTSHLTPHSLYHWAPTSSALMIVFRLKYEVQISIRLLEEGRWN